ncbi:Ribosome assembly protein 4 {ECO:0000303/PubMed:16221974} AltName: Full=Notchless protein homolog 1 {ECO:0000250/UniProtKB:Q9VPR4}; AltName: Full=Ribosome biogenesis factor RSA4 {ECO:0000303/PubMed:19737519} [Serendipita indica DSM 11827]|nr:Ribosome assembly protein 4 {ECO:0000303/PubMed:16221974} AltName: Full=Notchless protein homolog 1 {ECO:0000250/UniProtKB:Q9VPR4}; AltName: Full=Ribosome biogenesis factor RSA4 {ECO:0000303/PubMed:19737519} [Serendipita indica DSM 11827]
MSTQKSTKHKKRHLPTDSSGSSSAQRPTGKKRQVYDTLNVGLDVVANISEGSDVLAPLKAACRTTKSILEVATEINQEEWIDLAGRLKEYMSALEKQITLLEAYPEEDMAVDEAFRQPLIHYVEFLENMHDTIVDLKEKRNRSKLSIFKAFSKMKIDAEEIRKLNRDIEDRHRQFMEALGIFTALRMQNVERNTKTTKANVETILTDIDANAILQLPVVAFVASSVHKPCLKGTREAVLQTIYRWADDNTSDKPIFWLCDIAGSGKSTVAMSAAETWRNEGVLGGRFFFSIASSEGSTTDKFCSTIARDLVDYIPRLAPHVAGAVKRHPSFMRSSLEEQFQNFVIDPIHHSQERVILVIDALDECRSGLQRRELVEMLSTAVRGTKNLKVFMTSRPDPVIQAVLGSLSIKSKLEDRLHDVKHHDNIGDIAVYIHQALDNVLPEGKRQRLIEKANGLFIWASTACRMLTSQTSLSPPEITYDHLMSMDKAGAIDDLYNLIFVRMDPEFHTIMYKMLAVLLAAFEPLTATTWTTFSSIPGYTEVQRHWYGISAAYLLRMYLRRCSVAPPIDTRNNVYIRIPDAHGQAAVWCLKHLTSRRDGLKFNICQLESSFYLNREIPNLDTRVSRFISRRLRYASSHWLFHVAEADDSWRSIVKKKIQQITQVPYVLYWMEVLSLTRGVPRAITGLRAIKRHAGLETWDEVNMDQIRRFIMVFSVPIQESAPHIYISALPFTPTNSILHIEGAKMYSNTLCVTEGLEEMYPGLPSRLRGHEGEVSAVGFSPDGSQIVSGSSDNTIRLWDAATGQAVGEPLRGHEHWVNAVGFSPDGSQIVSGSSDNTIRLWDAATGQAVGEPLRGHEGVVSAVGFSPDGSQIVSGSSDNTIRLWDAATGQAVGEPLRGHEGRVNAVGFSPDGSQIVSGSDDNTIRLWDAATGQAVGEPLRGHEHWVNAVGFSPDGSQIVSGSSDNTIRLWDAATGQAVGEPLRGHEDWVLAVGFSPDGSQIVSGSSDNTIRLWDAATGQAVGEPLRGHEHWVNAVGFSPDGSQIVSGSSDNTIRLWDAATGQAVGEPLRGHEHWVNAVGFSPDGSQIVSGSSDNTIRLWDAATGQAVGEPLRGHEHWVNAVGFSPDGSQIVSGSSDKTIRLWDAATGQAVGEPLRGHEHWVNAVGFSPDGSQIVSGSDDNTIRLWDAATGQAVGEPLRGHEGRVNAVGFSPDGSQIVSGSSDNTIRLWDAATGQAVGEPLRGHEHWVNAVGFSPDGSQIVSGSSDNTIRLWDAATGQAVGEPLRGHEHWVNAVGFSPDGSQIVSGSSDNTIRLWDAATGQAVGEPLRGHEGRVNAVGFSPDGSQIVSGSSDKTIRLWDAATGQAVGEPLRGHEHTVSAAGFSPGGSQIVSGSWDKTIRSWDAETGEFNSARLRDCDATRQIALSTNANSSGKESVYSSLSEGLQATPLRIHVPGFQICLLSQDGWVHSSGKRLFWVPPDNRHGLKYPYLLTIPNEAPFRKTKFDFTNFQCGLSWTNVRTNVP